MTDAEKIAADPRATCPNFEDHTPCPEGYLQWHAWAEKMAKTHRPRKCAGCDRYSIWEPKRAIIQGETARRSPKRKS